MQEFPKRKESFIRGCEKCSTEKSPCLAGLDHISIPTAVATLRQSAIISRNAAGVSD
jgi:hypothetical protein